MLNLVRPKFLRMESSRPIARRIMSQVEISGRGSKGFADAAFTEAVEGTLLNDENFRKRPMLLEVLEN